MTDHEKLMVALVASHSTPEGTVTTGDVVRLLYELGAEHRERGRECILLSAAS